jgi:hypothetical protein
VYVADATEARPASGTTPITFTVTLSQASAAQVTVTYATHDSSATVANDDYVAQSGTLTFAPGITSQTVSVTVNAIAYPDSDKSFYLNLTKATNAVIADKAGQGNLVNPNGRLFIYVGDVVDYAGTGATTAQTQLMLSAPVPTGKTVTVQVATADGSATVANGDYMPVSLTTVTFVPGQQTAPVNITVNPQSAEQPFKNFFLNLSSSSSNAVISNTQSTISIVGHT